MEVDERASLDHELPYDGISRPVVDVADVAGGILVTIKLGWARHGVSARMWCKGSQEMLKEE